MAVRVPFRDRRDAAAQLAESLLHLAARKPLVLAIPRGGVPLGEVLARRLGGELDIVLVRKLGAPGQPELAVGAIDEGGWSWVAPHAARCGADEGWLRRERARQLALLHARRELYTPGRARADLSGRTVIVVDDGLATGATMLAALHAARERHPAWLVCAVPVASAQALALVRPLADETVCLEAPESLTAVGLQYLSFPQVDDDEVVRALRVPA